MSNEFVNLHTATSHSLHFGASSPTDIIAWALRFEQSAIAITDRDSLAGAVPFAKAAKDAGIKPIIGCELTDPVESNVAPKQSKPNRSAILLARNRKGYEFISQAITNRHLDKKFDFVKTLCEADENVVVLIHDPNLLAELSKRSSGNATIPVAILYLDKTCSPGSLACPQESISRGIFSRT